MTNDGTFTLLAFILVSSGVLLTYTLASGRNKRLDSRIDDLDHDRTRGDGFLNPSKPERQVTFTKTTLPKLGTALIPSDEVERGRLQTRLIYAGLYSRQAMAIFLGAKMVLIIAPALLGLGLGLTGLVPTQLAVLGGGCVGIVGLIGPSFWLDNRKAKRQGNFRRALPDALDLLVICLEGGLSLPGALKRVAAELRAVHPVLALELNIVQREIQLGNSPGESLQKMGLRVDLEEVRTLASVITQAERFGASLVKSLRVVAETLRLRRQQSAEEKAQKVAVKILFPTLIFIFPAVFVVVLGPAVFQIMEQLSQYGN